MKRKEKDNFMPIGESYTSLFQTLRQSGMIIPIPGYTLDPHSRNFDPNVRCAYHSNMQGHSTKNYRTLKKEIEQMIQEKLIMVQNICHSTIPQSSLPAHATAQYVGSNKFVERNVSDHGRSSSHADMQTSG